jgi:hypothetical protein
MKLICKGVEVEDNVKFLLGHVKEVDGESVLEIFDSATEKRDTSHIFTDYLNHNPDIQDNNLIAIMVKGFSRVKTKTIATL